MVNKKNKLNDTNNKGKYENNSKKSADTSSTLNNVVVCQNVGQKSNNSNVIINNNQLKNDTYESVCSPEDVAERTKMAQRHSIAVNGNSTIPTIATHNSNSAMPSNTNCNSNNNNINNSTLNNNNNSNSNSNNNNRVLKRVISAPVATNETKGNYFLRSLVLSLHLYLFLYLIYTHTFLYVYVESHKITTALNRLAIECPNENIYCLNACTYPMKLINFSHCHMQVMDLK